jgi:hypothetical protein
MSDNESVSASAQRRLSGDQPGHGMMTRMIMITSIVSHGPGRPPGPGALETGPVCYGGAEDGTVIVTASPARQSMDPSHESDDRYSARTAGTRTVTRRVGSMMIPNTLNVLCQCVYLVSDSKSISEVTRKYLESPSPGPPGGRGQPDHAMPGHLHRFGMQPP